MALATPQQLADFGYDPDAAAPYLYRAEARVRSYLGGRSSASAALTTPSLGLSEAVCSIASRMAATLPQIAMGATSEQSGGEQVMFGAQAYAGTSDLTDAEKRALDKIAPKLPFSVVMGDE